MGDHLESQPSCVGSIPSASSGHGLALGNTPAASSFTRIWCTRSMVPALPRCHSRSAWPSMSHILVTTAKWRTWLPSSNSSPCSGALWAAALLLGSGKGGWPCPHNGGQERRAPPPTLAARHLSRSSPDLSGPGIGRQPFNLLLQLLPHIRTDRKSPMPTIPAVQGLLIVGRRAQRAPERTFTRHSPGGNMAKSSSTTLPTSLPAGTFPSRNSSANTSMVSAQDTSIG